MRVLTHHVPLVCVGGKIDILAILVNHKNGQNSVIIDAIEPKRYFSESLRQELSSDTMNDEVCRTMEKLWSFEFENIFYPKTSAS